jgi:protein involved in polysaccharide export with SLBB domain
VRLLRGEEVSTPQGRRFRVLGAASASLLLAALCTAQKLEPYRVQINDVLDFLFFKNIELNQTQTVGPDGMVSLQLIGSVQVIGRTVDEITAEVTTLYAKELVHPQVTVAVKEYSGLKVYVGGEVQQPGIQIYRGGLTAVQAIFAAGGFKTTATLSSVLRIHKGPKGEPIGEILDLDRVLKHSEFGLDVALTPADMIFVPRSTIANINLFVEQYFRNMWPIPVGIGWSINVP